MVLPFYKIKGRKGKKVMKNGEWEKMILPAPNIIFSHLFCGKHQNALRFDASYTSF